MPEIDDKTKKKFLIRFSVMSALMLYDLDNMEANTKESEELKQMLEKHLELTYKEELIRSTSFLQTLENKFETAIRKTMEEYKIKV